MATASGATSATDKFFEENLLPVLDRLPRASFVEATSNQKRLLGDRARIALLERNLRPRLDAIRRQGATHENLSALLTEINSQVPHSSRAKDEYLENLCWTLRIERSELLDLVDAEKSHRSWRRIPPRNAQIASAISSHIQELSPQERFSLLSHLIDPEHHALPEIILEKLATAPEVQNANQQAATKERLRDAIRLFLTNSSRPERIPVVAFLLRLRPNPLINSEEMRTKLLRELMGVAPGSRTEMFISAYLEVTPPHEWPMTISYLLSLPPGGEDNLRNIFESFHNVGIRAAQLASLFYRGHLGDQLDELKDHAKPLSKPEIWRILESTLSPRELARIKHVHEILGSASLKTVVRVELTDGTEVAIAIQRPNATDHVRADLHRAMDFVAALRRRGIPIHEGVSDTLARGVEESTRREARFRDEARRIELARQHYERLNIELSGVLEGWTFRVPRLHSDFQTYQNLLVMELGPRQTLRQWNGADDSPEVGRAIVHASLRALFREGIFDPDRHRGNFLIDERNHVIYPIDFGQAEHLTRRVRFLPDDIFRMAQFLREVSAGTVEQIMTAVHPFLENPRAWSPEIAARVRQRISDTLSSHIRATDLDVILIDIMNAYAEHHAPLKHKLSFVLIKGLAILMQERYVQPSEFIGLVQHEVESAIRSRPLPAVVYEARRDDPNISSWGICVRLLGAMSRGQ